METRRVLSVTERFRGPKDGWSGAKSLRNTEMSDFSLLARDIAPRDPFSVARAVDGWPRLAFLDSSGDYGALGRYSYVAADPFGIYRVEQGRAFWNGTPLETDPITALRDLLARYRLPTVDDLPPFQTGAIGFLAYEAARLFERSIDAPAPEPDIPDLEFGFYDTVFIHDRHENRSRILSSGWPETDPERRLDRAETRIEAFLARLERTPPALPDIGTTIHWRRNLTQDGFEAAVSETKHRILAGDLFQANIAERFTAELNTDFSPFAFYGRLRAESPAPFGAFLACGSLTIASNSPERFLSLSGRRIEARPIKGTAPRGSTPSEDRALADALTRSVKDRAENTMIVDLLRNDLSRVSDPFSVKVPTLCGLETYASVHHLVSVVTGDLTASRDALDLIAAAFPCGSITGAPKPMAMTVIGALEQVSRGIYCGAIGWLGFDGAMDLNVAIRTVTFRPGSASFHAGGGITALSDPGAEHDETLTKAERIFRAFRASDAGAHAA